MKKVANVLVSFLVLEHIYIFVLEAFLWNTPLGHRTFNLTPEFAEASQALALNQGVYNGFLAAGLIWGLLTTDKMQAARAKLFFSACIFVAGIVGGATALPKIYFIQALPALLTIIALVAAGNWKKVNSSILDKKV